MRVVAILGAIGAVLLFGCQKQEAPAKSSDSPPAAPAVTAHATNVPPLDPTNIVSIASGSPDHTTLVAALKA